MTRLIYTPLLALIVGCSQNSMAPPVATEQIYATGLKIYTANCASCHQVDGYGVSNMQPALVDDPVLAGDPNVVIAVLLQGPANVLPAGRPHFSNSMPKFSRLSDQEISDLLTYLRHKYGHEAEPITPQKVRAIRSQVGSRNPV